MTPQQLDDILQAVEAHHFPDYLDKDELAADLQDARLEYDMGTWARQGRSSEQKELEQIRATAIKLRGLLNPPYSGMLGREQPNHKKGINRLIEDVERALNGPRFQGEVVGQGPPPARVYVKEVQGGNLSAFEWLAGVKLPEIFERHFGIKAKVDRDPDRGSPHRPPEGPYIDFAEQCLIVLDITKNGEPYSRESIARALTKSKSARSQAEARRKQHWDRSVGKFVPK